MTRSNQAGRSVTPTKAARGGVALTLALLASAVVSHLNPGPTIDVVSIWPDTVRRGSMSRQVRAVGTLTAEGGVLRVPAARAHDIAIGQPVSVDTRAGLVPGSVSRIDPTPTNGLVTVDVRLTGALPRGARPGLTVDGIVELERLENVVYVGMPAFSQEHSTRTIFKVVRGCDLTHASCDAVRQRVRFGRASINTIEIVDGLEPGDQVVLSDMSTWDGLTQARLN